MLELASGVAAVLLCLYLLYDGSSDIAACGAFLHDSDIPDEVMGRMFLVAHVKMIAAAALAFAAGALLT